MNDHIKGWPTAGEIYVQADNPSLMLSPPDSEHLDIYFQEVNDSRHKHQIAEDGTEINALGTRIGTISAFTIWQGLNLFDYFGVGGEDQEFYDWGLTREIIIGFNGVPSSNPTVSTEIFIPYNWAGPNGRDGLDLAEILWSWVKFHTGLLAQGVMDDHILDQPSFSAYSTRLEDWRWRQRFKIFREVNTTILEKFVELAKASSVFLGWGHQSGVIRAPALRMHDFRDIPENTRILKFDYASDEENPLQLSRPRVRHKDQNLLNERTIKWGTIVNLRLSNGVPPLTASLGSPPAPPDQENVVRMVDQSSVDNFGSRSLATSSPWVVDGASAVGASRITDFQLEDSEVSLAMGPLHFDFWPGEKIHVRDILQGLDGSEDLFVDAKEYDLDLHTATVTATTLKPSPFMLNPEDLEDLTRVFAYFRADAGITASAGRVTAWIDQIGTNNLTQHGSLPNPKLLTAYQSGKDVIHFDGDNIGAGGGGVLDLILSTSPKMNMTVLALLEMDNASQLDNNLLGSQGALSGLSDEWLLHCGNSGAGGTPKGMGWDWNAGANMQIDGPQLPTTGWVIAIWNPWTIKANWAIHDGNRSRAQWIDMSSAAAMLDDHHVDGGATGTPLLFRADRVDWDRATIIGADRAGALRLRARMATLLIMQHAGAAVGFSLGVEKGPLLPHELEGIVNYWASEWGL
jgi:hypothetical protein